MTSLILIVSAIVIAAIFLRLSEKSRRPLVCLYRAYCALMSLIGSLILWALAFGLGWAGWKLAELFWPNLFFIAGGGVLILIGLSLFFSALPGVTHEPRTGSFGKARTADGRDLRRSGILKGE